MNGQMYEIYQQLVMSYNRGHNSFIQKELIFKSTCKNEPAITAPKLPWSGRGDRYKQEPKQKGTMHKVA